MSVINQMLRDLDARAAPAGSEGAAPAGSEAAVFVAGAGVIAAVPAPGPRAGRRTLVALAALVLVALAMLLAWWLRKPAPAAAAVSVSARPAAPVRPAVKTIILEPAPAPGPAAAAPVPVAPAPAPITVAAVAAPLPPTTAPVTASASTPAQAPPAAKPEAPAAPKQAASTAQAAVIDSPYRRALALLREGRRQEAASALAAIVREQPRQAGARETLIGLLIEDGRSDEAMAQLETALAADPRQPAMAMLLARLQIAGGGDGLATLARSLPSVDADAGSEAGAPEALERRASYHAFYAGALQRRQRHHEAALQYQAALREAPANAASQGVWLMGLGLALRGEGRNAEALDAWRRARASGALSGELDAYVERLLQGR